MSIERLRSRLGSFAADMRLNLSTVLSADGAPDLTPRQIQGVALASAFSTRDEELIRELLEEARTVLSPEEVEAARTAASLMGMNNVYYRFLHLVEDPEFSRLPARLRMNAMASPGIPKLDFELYSLAVSAISGCGKCIQAHVKGLKDQGLSAQGIQSAVRIASVVNGAAQTLAAGRVA